jgi:RHS repeat-associated protein
VTYIVNSSQAMAATYKYDPYGRTLSSSGTLASANVYRFSSKEIHPNSGFYYYGFRFYDPNTQRWLNRDPIGEAGGINVYEFGPNSPLNGFDPDGFTWGTNVRFMCDWFFGRGPRNRYYDASTIECREMSKSLGARRLRNSFYEQGCQDVGVITYRSEDAYCDTVLTLNWGSTAFQVGGFANASAKNNGDGTVTFCIPNVAGMRSFFFHICPDNVFGRNGPMGNISQTFCWTERIDKCKCKNYQ